MRCPCPFSFAAALALAAALASVFALAALIRGKDRREGGPQCAAVVVRLASPTPLVLCLAAIRDLPAGVALVGGLFLDPGALQDCSGKSSGLSWFVLENLFTSNHFNLTWLWQSRMMNGDDKARTRRLVKRIL